MKKKLFGGLVALALALAPAAAAHADYVDPTELHGELDKYIVDPGETVTYTAPTGTYTASEDLTHTLTGVNGHTATTAALRTAPSDHTSKQFAAASADDGAHTFAFVIPTQAGAEYVFQIHRADGTLWETFDITVANPTVGGPDDGNGGNGGSGGDNGAAGAGNNATGGNGGTGGLAMTGSDIAVAGIAGSAALLVGAGVVLMLVRRRRRSEETAAA